jgi:hypothetical protein
MTDEQKKLLQEMRDHLAKLHTELFNDPEYDGHCKSNEGYVGLLYRLGNWFEYANAEDYKNAEPKLSTVEVYSYLFGPNRLHQYNTIEEAYEQVMSW